MLSKLLNLKELKKEKQIQYEVDLDINQILKKVQHINVRKGNDLITISEQQFVTLCRDAKDAVLSQPSFLRLSCPMIVATGTLGYYHDLGKVLKCGHPKNHNYLFLGDYVGRGNSSIQCLVALMCYKISFPQNFFMLRGCNDSIAMTRSNKFYDECLNRFSPKAWTEACQFLCSLPFAAVIQNQIFCVHGGLSPQLLSLDQINKIPRPIQTPEVGIPCDLIWSDPAMNEDALLWQKSIRGFGYCWNSKVTTEFLKDNFLSMIVRAHQVVYDGFQYNKQKNLATICSLADYCGLYQNSAAVLNIDNEMNIYFKVITERKYFPIERNPDESADMYLQKLAMQKRKAKKQRQLQEKEQEQKKWEQKMKQERQEKETRQRIKALLQNKKKYESKAQLEKIQQSLNQQRQECHLVSHPNQQSYSSDTDHFSIDQDSPIKLSQIPQFSAFQAIQSQSIPQQQSQNKSQSDDDKI